VSRGAAADVRLFAKPDTERESLLQAALGLARSENRELAARLKEIVVEIGVDHMGEYDRANAYRAEKEAKEAKERAVHREPTDAMIRAGTEAWQRSYPGYTIDRLGDVWRAMWDASP
jgi:hypothetical protein